MKLIQFNYSIYINEKIENDKIQFPMNIIKIIFIFLQDLFLIQ